MRSTTMKYKQSCFRMPQKRTYFVHYLSRDTVTKFLMESLTRLQDFTVMPLFHISFYAFECLSGLGQYTV
jgi:hypothetical protein